MHGSGGAFYENFTVGPESTSYAVTFDSFRPKGVDNGFSTSAPVVFNAQGNDVNGCFNQRKSAGWYGADCSGYSMFSSGGSLYWPVTGQPKAIGSMEFNLVRMSSYYDD